MSVDAYLAARAALEETRAELKQLLAVFTRVQSALQLRPLEFTFSNTEIQMPEAASHSLTSVVIDAGSWPTAEAINALVARLHERTQLLMAVWGNLPENIRSALKSPSDLVPRR